MKFKIIKPMTIKGLNKKLELRSIERQSNFNHRMTIKYWNDLINSTPYPLMKKLYKEQLEKYLAA